jgi:hypothetical protein
MIQWGLIIAAALSTSVQLGCAKRQQKTIEVTKADQSGQSTTGSDSGKSSDADERRGGSGSDEQLGSVQSNQDPGQATSSNSGSADTDPGRPLDAGGGASGDPLSTRDTNVVGADATPTELTVEEVAQLLSINEQQASGGRAYVNGLNQETPWDGTADEPAKNNAWRLVQPSFNGSTNSASPNPSPSQSTGVFGSIVGGQTTGVGSNPSGLPASGGQTTAGVPNGGVANAGGNSGGAETGPNGEAIFRIAAGTGDQPWNTQTTPIRARVGQPIIVYNDDTIVHQIHTDGVPFPHGNEIAPGRSARVVPTRVFRGTLYDHLTNARTGRQNPIYLEVTN